MNTQNTETDEQNREGFTDDEMEQYIKTMKYLLKR